MTQAGPKPYGLKEAVAHLNKQGTEVTERTLRRWKDAGCPHHKAAGKRGRITFDTAEVLKWMKEMGRTGQAGRPAVGTQEPARSSSESGSLFPGNADLGRLTREVNLQIKRLEAAKRERVEEEARGELVPLDDVSRFWAGQTAVVQTAFQSLPGRLAPLLVNREYDEIYSILDVELRRVLDQFSRELPAL